MSESKKKPSSYSSTVTPFRDDAYGQSKSVTPQKTSEVPTLPQHLSKAQLTFITQKTPRKFIKQRPGPGGMVMSYVEVGYVINILNQVFGWDWDFRIIDQQIGNKQVWVRGELVVHLDDHTVTKAQYGGADIKFNRNTQPISIADDLKAAASDCLKKCASLLGIAGDLYSRDLDSWEE